MSDDKFMGLMVSVVILVLLTGTFSCIREDRKTRMECIKLGNTVQECVHINNR